ncbi:MAG: PQQ-dependent sugar dehydrogenase [Actinomycetota bacterium]|nr:PQQ-dependent sugar dehydrogenase [Actinomycetota bacterium]
MRSLGWKAFVLAGLVILFVGAGTGAAVCKFTDAACGLNPAGDMPAPTGIEDFEGQGQGEMGLENGLAVSTVVSDLRFPTDFDFLPDGRILVAEKNGFVRVVDDGKVSVKPVLDLRNRINRHFFRGIVNVTVDADFPAEPYVYVAYAVRGPKGPDSDEAITARISRFSVRGDTAVMASEKVLFGSEKPARGSCRRLPRGADCLPAEVDHIGTDMAFTPQGTILVSTGDGGGQEVVEPLAFLAQEPDTLGGKILHVDRDGRGVSENPYWSGDPDAIRSKVWATGLRNPFRISAVTDSADTLVVGDVGWNTFEELHIVRRGSDLGWPCFEGPERTPEYQDTDFCRRYYGESSPDEPWYSVPQPDGSSITAGVAMGTAEGWPDGFADHYVFADWTKSELYAVPLDLDAPAEEPRTIATNAAGPVAFALRPEGLYFLAVNTGELRLIAPA